MTCDDTPDFYARHGEITDPGVHGDNLRTLPGQIGDLCRLVQSLVLHVFWAERHGVKLSEERGREVGLRKVERQLARILELDPGSLTEPRPLERRLVGTAGTSRS